jgi:hypothetical protein
MLITQTGNTSEWQMLVNEAAQLANTRLDEEIESYLVFTLMRFMRRADMVNRVLALDYLAAFECNDSLKGETLRDVGDHCLLFSGLFPKIAEKRRVKVSYFVDLGRAAYQNVAGNLKQFSGLYNHLAYDFVAAMDTLQAISKISNKDIGLSALQSFELVQDCNSEMARQYFVAPDNKIFTLKNNESKLKH